MKNIFISMRNILSCEVHNSKMLPWQHHMQPFFKHLPLPDVAWFFSFSPQQLAFSSQQPSVCANGWSQWRLKILCYRLLSTLDTCQASKQINQSSDIENVQQTITATDAVEQTWKILRVNFPMKKWEKNRLMLLWSLQWNGVLQAMQEHFFCIYIFNQIK